MTFLAVLGANLDATMLVLFSLALGLFLLWEWRRGEKLEVQQLVPYVVYMIMYRTKWGLVKMDAWAKRFKPWLRMVSPIIVATGLLGMVTMTVYMVVAFVRLFTAPSAVAPAQLVLPIKSHVTFYVPFFYWIIAIFLIATVHEFAHGVIARHFKMRVKSSGFAFLGLVLPIIPAAFVEPDEKQILKRPWEEQVAVYGAGPFINIVFGILSILLVSIAFAPIAHSIAAQDTLPGAGINSFTNGSAIQAAGATTNERILAIDNETIGNGTALLTFLETTHPGQRVNVTTNSSSYSLALGSGAQSYGYLGFVPELPLTGTLANQPTIVQNMVLAASTYRPLYPAPAHITPWCAAIAVWIIGLLSFLFILNLGIGLSNLLPIFITDGARILWVTLRDVFGMSEDRSNKITFLVGWVLLALLVVLIVLPLTPLQALLMG